MKRTDVVVPEILVDRLRIPAMAVTNGAPDPEWVEVPMSRLRFRRHPSQRLPLDPRSAASARRFLRMAPWTLAASLVAIAASAAGFFVDLPPSLHLAAALLGAGLPFLTILVQDRGMPLQVPFRTPYGDLRIPGVPADVAHAWVAQNPGVTCTDEPPARRYPPRFYAIWSVGLLLAAALLTVVLATDGRENDTLIWMLVPTMLIAGVVMAYRIAPPER